MLGKPPGFEEAVGSPFFFESYLVVGRGGGRGGEGGGGPRALWGPWGGGGRSPMSPVNFKKCPCRHVDFNKCTMSHVTIYLLLLYKCPMSLSPNTVHVAVSSLGVYIGYACYHQSHTTTGAYVAAVSALYINLLLHSQLSHNRHSLLLCETI